MLNNINSILAEFISKTEKFSMNLYALAIIKCTWRIMYISPLLLSLNEQEVIRFDKVFNSLLFCLTAHNKIWIYDQLKVCLFACKRRAKLLTLPLKTFSNSMLENCIWGSQCFRMIKGILPISSIQNNKFKKNRLFQCPYWQRNYFCILASLVRNSTDNIS